MTSHARLVARYSSISTAVLTAISFALACYAVPISGPYCPYESDCITTPSHFVRIADRFPRDYFWMMVVIPQLVSYLIMMVSVQACATSQSKKLYGTIAEVFATVATTILVTDYYVQLSVIQPSILAGETDHGLALLTMYNEKGVFIALEEVGYLFMSASFMAVSPLFSAGVLRFLLVSAFVLTLLSLLYFIVIYGWERSYRFEVAVITIDWTTLIVCGTLMARQFRARDKNGKLD